VKYWNLEKFASFSRWLEEGNLVDKADFKEFLNRGV